MSEIQFIDRNPMLEYNGKSYINTETGKKISEKDMDRIRRLKIPRVYKTIWLSTDPFSDLQAVAVGAKGKKQYFYSNYWNFRRDKEKFKRMYQFLRRLPVLMYQIGKDTKLSGYPKRKTIAFMVLIMRKTNIRVGNKKYLDQNKSFGLTTLQKKHAKVVGSRVFLKFKGKHSVEHDIKFQDKRIANFLKKMLNIPTKWLMKYKSDTNVWYRVSAQELNNYIHDIMGNGFTCKDFRTYGANLAFMKTLKSLPIPDSQRKLKSNVSKALEKASQMLGNNKSTSRKSYIMNFLIEEYNRDPEMIKNTELIGILKKCCK